MLGPNLFCWMDICSVGYSVNSFAYHVKPKTYDDVEHVITTIIKHKGGIDQYRYSIRTYVWCIFKMRQYILVKLIIVFPFSVVMLPVTYFLNSKLKLLYLLYQTLHAHTYAYLMFRCQ